jgi:hypothetical protein
MEIKVGNYDVFKDGTIVGNENEPIDFIIIKELGFTIRIVFSSDSNIKDAQIKATEFDKVGALLTFVNFNNSIGIGNIEPLLIGHFNNRELFLNYRVYSLEKGGKTFHYTWLLGKEVTNVK